MFKQAQVCMFQA